MMPPKEESLPVSLDTLLEAYPDMSVLREREGSIHMIQELVGANNRHYSFGLWSDDSDQNLPSVVIVVRDQSKDGKNDPNRPYTRFILNRSGDSAISVEIENNQVGIELKEVIKKTQQGFDIFYALLRTPVSERSKFNHRAYDYMAGHDLVQDLGQFGIGEEAIYESGDPEKDWMYFNSMVRKNII